MDVSKIINNIGTIDDNQISKKTLSEDKVTESVEKTKVNKNINIDKSIDKLNKLLEKNNTHAEYSIYEELGTTMVKIIDDNTNKVIMEIPKEKVLDAVAAMMKNTGLLDEKV